MGKAQKTSEVEVEEQEPAAPTAAWGRRLRDEREARGLSVEDISSELRLEPHLIRDIEEENLDALPSAPFVKGYLRSYARLLELDDVRIINAYTDLGVEDAPGLKKLTNVQETTSQHAGARVATWVVVALVAVSAVAWLWSEMTTPVKAVKTEPSSLTQSDEEMNVVDVVGLPTQVVTEMPTTTEVPDSSSETLEAEAPLATRSERAAEAVVESGSSTEVVPASDATLASVTLSFSGESWVEIVDARNERLFTNIGRPDTERTVEGVPPFSVLLGNAPVVTLKYNGQPYDLVRHNRKGVARFTLGESASE